MPIPARTSEISECRQCCAFCDRVVHPAGCLASGCQYLYLYDDEETGARYMGCLNKVFRVEIDLLGVRGVRRVEDEHLDLRLEVVERGEQHRVALLRADPLGLGDHPADRDPLAVALVGEVGQRAFDPRAIWRC